jgi:hypothetical protein
LEEWAERERERRDGRRGEQGVVAVELDDDAHVAGGGEAERGGACLFWAAMGDLFCR